MTRRCCLSMLLCAFLAGIPVQAFAASPPYFTWGAFQRFWNKMCSTGMEMEQFTATPIGFSVNYGRGVVINVALRGEQVWRLNLLFDSREEQGGGPLFLRGVNTAIRLGAYGWPQERVDAAVAMFASITAEKRTYQWEATRFTRTGYENGMWEFVMEYLFQ